MTTNAAEKLPESKETYRDEMNFAEFPLALLDRPSEGQKTIVFSDTIRDYGKGGVPVIRKLTISASDRYGLPTPRDEEVILGLIQLSHQAGFADRKVHFTKGDLVRLLGWSDDGKSYQRITEALNKWVGVTLFWENAWWSKEERSFVNETFHILDNVTLFDKERYARRVSMSGGDPAAGKSSFVWNDKVFASFKSGYIKQLDLNFFKSLDSSISKKMFRFLDKRFYKSRSLDFELQNFAFEHIGLARNYHNGEIKRKLRPAIAELEERGFLERMTDEQRFTKESRGVWNVHFVRAGSAKEIAEVVLDDLGRELTGRGVSPRSAEDIVEKFPQEIIWEKIKFHDSLVAKKDKRISKNPAGFLVSAIKEDFKTGDLCSSKPTVRAVLKKIPPPSPFYEVKEAQSRKNQNKFDLWWQGLTIPEQNEFEQAALASADKFSLRQYESGKEGQGTLFRTVRMNILLSHFATVNHSNVPSET